MSSTKLHFELWIIFYLCFHAPPAMSFVLQLPDVGLVPSCNISEIYQLGASFSDTGNRIVQDPTIGSSRLPYGMSTFLGPSGRFSDGLLMIDYIALAAGLPLLNPYLKDNANFDHGVNFAVGGATALSPDALALKNITPDTNSSLGIQVEWMSSYFTSQDIHCSHGSLNNSLFLVGEIGRNDYTSAFFQGKTVEEAKNMVPEVIDDIKNAVKRVVDLGAKKVIVPGLFPVGCLPLYLRIFKSTNESAYDEHQCLKEFNDFIAFHNEYVQQTIISLQEENPHITIVYGDYYNAFIWLLVNAPQLGFDAPSVLKLCCGTSDSSTKVVASFGGCGSPSSTVCSNPDQYIHWDGIHFTQKAHSILAIRVLADLIPKLNCAVQVEDYLVGFTSPEWNRE